MGTTRSSLEDSPAYSALCVVAGRGPARSLSPIDSILEDPARTFLGLHSSTPLLFGAHYKGVTPYVPTYFFYLRSRAAPGTRYVSLCNFYTSGNALKVIDSEIFVPHYGEQLRGRSPEAIARLRSRIVSEASKSDT